VWVYRIKQTDENNTQYRVNLICKNEVHPFPPFIEGKWYDHDDWRPIKAAIHNCYKLLQNGYVPENQIELENNIKILNILLKESNYKKSNVDKITEEVMQNI